MPRRSYKKNIADPDPVHKSIEVAKLINYVMVDGKKTVARKIVYGVLDRFSKEGKDGLQVLREAIQNVAPRYEVKPRRLGGASYLVPVEVKQERQLYLSLNWIVQASQSRPNKEFHTFGEKLYTELKEASENKGQAVTKKLQIEKLAETNKAFAHLKW